MRKFAELSFQNSCMSNVRPDGGDPGVTVYFRARPGEMTFVLLGRDAAAPVAIRAWVAERIRLGKNTATDEQIVEALECAELMVLERTHQRTEPLIVVGYEPESK